MKKSLTVVTVVALMSILGFRATAQDNKSGSTVQNAKSKCAKMAVCAKSSKEQCAKKMARKASCKQAGKEQCAKKDACKKNSTKGCPMSSAKAAGKCKGANKATSCPKSAK